MFVAGEEIRFIKELEDVKVTESKATVTLECELSKAGLRVEWTKDKKALRRDERCDIVADGRVHRLVIEDVKSEDIGKYSCTYEKLSTMANLTIAG